MDALTTKAMETLIVKILPQLVMSLEELKETAPDARNPDPEMAGLVDEACELLGLLRGWAGGATVASAESEELSDEEAAMLLADMDSPPSSADNASDDELSDEEAAMLLADMDAPPENTELSDDEAARLLAEMDAPVKDDMSDDEAAKLLADMDAPAASSEDLSADDEAEALLAQLGGEMDDDEVPEEAPPQEVSAAAPTEEESEELADCEEIPEWEANEFQSDPDMLNDFITNADEIMENLDDAILRMEESPDDKEIIEEIFRAAHTLKGAAGMFGFKGLERVMHRLENLFDLIRKGKMKPTSTIVDAVFEGMDVIRTLLEAVKEGEPCGAKTAPIVKALTLVAMGKTPVSSRSAVKGASAKEEASADGDSGDGGEKKAKNKKKNDGSSTIRVDLDRLDALVNLIGELVIDRTRFVSIEEELRTNYPQEKLTGRMAETVQLFGRHMNEIQDIIMKVRMVPIGNAFNKFPRVVRDLGKSLGKSIDLFISGESAELDKTLVEQIGDPLIHLIRNSCDHGIEMPEDRKSNGKSPNGKVYLSARQESNHIVITIEDDGKGMPVDILRKKGIEKGLISEEDKLSDHDIYNLIFEPGFSTAEKVTNVSGRGVGMDVVKKQIMKLKGMIDINSTWGKGTSITISLPLTLAIVQSLLVRIKGDVFAIPLGSVIESIRITPDEIQRVGESEVIKLRDRVLPLMHLDSTLCLSTKDGSIPDYLAKKMREDSSDEIARKKDRLFVVVVGQQDRPFGIVVDQLLNQQEMVIKSLGPLMKNIPYVAGGAVLGHGEVVLVLDVQELQETFRAKTRGLAA